MKDGVGDAICTPGRLLDLGSSREMNISNEKISGDLVVEKNACFYGGESKRFNIKTLKDGVDVAICTQEDY